MNMDNKLIHFGVHITNFDISQVYRLFVLDYLAYPRTYPRKCLGVTMPKAANGCIRVRMRSFFVIASISLHIVLYGAAVFVIEC